MNDHPVLQVRMIRRLLCAKIYKRLHYWVGVSQDNAIQIMNFFTGLDLSKSQADSLLSQLADDWEQQRDTIAELIALQTVLYIDETGWKTGWKVGAKSCYKHPPANNRT